MKVRRHYADGTTDDFEMINGKHIVTFEAGQDVPGSKSAIEANGKQIRYLNIPVNATKELKKIEFIKGDDITIPLVFAITVEFADSSASQSTSDE